jgi:hypothetical protein
MPDENWFRVARRGDYLVPVETDRVDGDSLFLQVLMQPKDEDSIVEAIEFLDDHPEYDVKGWIEFYPIKSGQEEHVEYNEDDPLEEITSEEEHDLLKMSAIDIAIESGNLDLAKALVRHPLFGLVYETTPHAMRENLWVLHPIMIPILKRDRGMFEFVATRMIKDTTIGTAVANVEYSIPEMIAVFAPEYGWALEYFLHLREADIDLGPRTHTTRKNECRICKPDRSWPSPIIREETYRIIEMVQDRENMHEVHGIIAMFVTRTPGFTFSALLRLGEQRHVAAHLFAHILTICEEYVCVVEPEASEERAMKAASFFDITARVPMELQMYICQLSASVIGGRDTHRTKAITPTESQLAYYGLMGGYEAEEAYIQETQGQTWPDEYEFYEY